MKEREATRLNSSRYTDKTFYLENLGCAKNQVDAESIISSLEHAGYTYSDQPGKADYIIVNTCGFIESAKKESVDAAFSLKSRFPGSKIILTGCLAERYGSTMSEILPEADGIIGNNAPGVFADTLARLLSGGGKLLMPEKNESMPVRERLLTYPGSAYLKIAEGCSNRCTYCAIPLIRGPLSSRSVDDIVAEARELLARGCFEFNLVAQDLGSFGLDRGSVQLDLLLERLLEMEGDFWIRLLYIHPDRFPKEILPRIRADRRVLPYFDVPFQHASSRILRGMNRSGSSEKYLDLISGIRESVPGAVIRSTFLVGFPGETAKDFDELLRFQEKASLLWAGAFAYSREEDTPAYSYRGSFGDRLAAPVARKRMNILQERQIPITERALDAFVGTKLRVLVEERVEGEELYLARAYLNAPEVDGLVVLHGSDLIPGRVYTAAIAKRNGLDLEAVIASEAGSERKIPSGR